MLNIQSTLDWTIADSIDHSRFIQTLYMFGPLFGVKTVITVTVCTGWSHWESRSLTWSAGFFEFLVRFLSATKEVLQNGPSMVGDLHERDLWVEPLPFLRALFLKARMAWQKHKEDDDPLPDPAQFADTFSDFCDTWNDFMVGKFLSSIRQLNSAGGTQSIKQTLKSSVAQELPETTATITVLFEYQVSMIPCYQYPHINDTQNQVSTIRWTKYQW